MQKLVILETLDTFSSHADNVLQKTPQISDKMSGLKVGIIGAGKMAGALVQGWVGKGVVAAGQVNDRNKIYGLLMLKQLAGDGKCS